MTLVRAIVLAAAVALTAILALAALHGGSCWPVALPWVVMLCLLLVERFRYKPLADAAPPGWEATGEKFVDTETGREVTVFYDPTTGERRYVTSGD